MQVVSHSSAEDPKVDVRLLAPLTIDGAVLENGLTRLGLAVGDAIAADPASAPGPAIAGAVR